MEENKLFVEIHEEFEDYYLTRQSVECSVEPEVRYYVYNLTECPEDATIERSLFSAQEYIKAINLGIKLAQKGYTKVEAEYIKESD